MFALHEDYCPGNLDSVILFDAVYDTCLEFPGKIAHLDCTIKLPMYCIKTIARITT